MVKCSLTKGVPILSAESSGDDEWFEGTESGGDEAWLDDTKQGEEGAAGDWFLRTFRHSSTRSMVSAL